jgi:hypothetical protein
VRYSPNHVHRRSLCIDFRLILFREVLYSRVKQDIRMVWMDFRVLPDWFSAQFVHAVLTMALTPGETHHKLCKMQIRAFQLRFSEKALLCFGMCCSRV